MDNVAEGASTMGVQQGGGQLMEAIHLALREHVEHDASSVAGKAAEVILTAAGVDIESRTLMKKSVVKGKKKRAGGGAAATSGKTTRGVVPVKVTVPSVGRKNITATSRDVADQDDDDDGGGGGGGEEKVFEGEPSRSDMSREDESVHSVDSNTSAERREQTDVFDQQTSDTFDGHPDYSGASESNASDAQDAPAVRRRTKKKKKKKGVAKKRPASRPAASKPAESTSLSLGGGLRDAQAAAKMTSRSKTITRFRNSRHASSRHSHAVNVPVQQPVARSDSAVKIQSMARSRLKSAKHSKKKRAVVKLQAMQRGRVGRRMSETARLTARENDVLRNNIERDVADATAGAGGAADERDLDSSDPDVERHRTTTDDASSSVSSVVQGGVADSRDVQLLQEEVTELLENREAAEGALVDDAEEEVARIDEQRQRLHVKLGDDEVERHAADNASLRAAQQRIDALESTARDNHISMQQRELENVKEHDESLRKAQQRIDELESTARDNHTSTQQRELEKVKEHDDSLRNAQQRIDELESTARDNHISTQQRELEKVKEHDATDQLQEQLQVATGHNDTLKTEMEAIRDQAAGREAELERVQAETDAKLADANQRLREATAHHETRESEATRVHAELSQDGVRQSLLNEQATEDKSKLQARTAELEGKLRDAEVAACTLEEVLSSTKLGLHEAETRARDATSKATVASTVAERMTVERDQQAAELISLQFELSKATQRAGGLEATHRGAATEHEALAVRHGKVEAELAAMRANHAQASIDASSEGDRLRHSTKQQIEAIQAEHRQTQVQLQSTTETHAETVIRVQDAHATQAAVAANQIETLQRDCEARETEVREANEAIAKLQAAVKDDETGLARSRSKAEARRREDKTRHDALEAQLQTGHKTHAGVEAELGLTKERLLEATRNTARMQHALDDLSSEYEAARDGWNDIRAGLQNDLSTANRSSKASQDSLVDIRAGAARYKTGLGVKSTALRESMRTCEDLRSQIESQASTQEHLEQRLETLTAEWADMGDEHSILEISLASRTDECELLRGELVNKSRSASGVKEKEDEYAAIEANEAIGTAREGKSFTSTNDTKAGDVNSGGERKYNVVSSGASGDQSELFKVKQRLAVAEARISSSTEAAFRAVKAAEESMQVEHSSMIIELRSELVEVTHKLYTANQSRESLSRIFSHSQDSDNTSLDSVCLDHERECAAAELELSRSRTLQVESALVRHEHIHDKTVTMLRAEVRSAAKQHEETTEHFNSMTSMSEEEVEVWFLEIQRLRTELQVREYDVRRARRCNAYHRCYLRCL